MLTFFFNKKNKIFTSRKNLVNFVSNSHLLALTEKRESHLLALTEKRESHLLAYLNYSNNSNKNIKKVKNAV